MTIEDVKTTIRQGNQALKEARTTIEQANAHLLDATSIALIALHGTDHDEANKARAGLRDAADEIELVLRRLTAAADHADAYLAALG
jgi:predicted  nucleic acid-binding Zn-ribbon protein